MLNLFEFVEKVGGGIVARYLHHKTDAYIISYPNSGRNWLRVLIGKTLCKKFDFDDDLILDTYKLTSKAGLLRTQSIHDHSSYTESYKYSYLPTDKSAYSGKKVILLIRKIKDVLVSNYFHVTRRDGNYTGNISDFIRSDKYGAKRFIEFYNEWHGHREIPKEFMLLRYEDLHNNPNVKLAKILKFLGLDEVEEHILVDAVEFARFNNMKKLEREDFFKREAIRPGNINDDESYKVRKGVIGGYKSYLSEADMGYIDELIRKLGCPFLNHD